MFKTFGRILKTRILITCFATAMVFFSMTALSVPTSKAVPAIAMIVETYYYTDSTYTVQCGYKYKNCQGQIRAWGCVNVWKVEYTEPCGSFD